MQFMKVHLAAAFLTIFSTAAFGQFSYQKVKDAFAYEQPKALSYYSNSHFNRVEGLFLSFGFKVKPPQLTGLALWGDLGYGFKNESGERWKYSAGLQKDFFFPARFSVGLRAFDELFTQDRWIISATENSVAAIFGHNDYMDYVGRKGFQGYLDYKVAQIHNLRVEVGRYKYELLNSTPNTNWSLFAKSDQYAPNPHPFPGYKFTAGYETSIRLLAAFDYRDNPIFPLVGWYFEGIFEKTFDDFETDGLFLTVKRFQPTFGNQRAMAKVLFGTRSGSFAFQHLMGIGGVGSLRGYRNKEFIGNRALFGTLRYNFGGDLLQKLPLQKLPFYEALSMGAFFDFGYAWVADPADANAGLFDFGHFGLSDLRTNIGLSLLFTEGLLRFDFARRLEGSGGWQVYFRILDNF